MMKLLAPIAAAIRAYLDAPLPTLQDQIHNDVLNLRVDELGPNERGWVFSQNIAVDYSGQAWLSPAAELFGMPRKPCQNAVLVNRDPDGVFSAEIHGEKPLPRQPNIEWIPLASFKVAS